MFGKRRRMWAGTPFRGISKQQLDVAVVLLRNPCYNNAEWSPEQNRSLLKVVAQSLPSSSAPDSAGVSWSQRLENIIPGYNLIGREILEDSSWCRCACVGGECHSHSRTVFISKAFAIGYKQASVHKNFSVSLVTTQPNALVAQLNPHMLRTAKQTRTCAPPSMDSCMGWNSCHCHLISEPKVSMGQSCHTCH